jgi:hypothetical protein
LRAIAERGGRTPDKQVPGQAAPGQTAP